MALLSSTIKQALRAEYGQKLSERRESFNLTKAQLDAVINAIDGWIDANAASFNSAIPQPQRGLLTAAQKADLFFRVALARFGG